MTVKTQAAVRERAAARASGRDAARPRRQERRLSRADRVARGKDARASAPLESHAEFTPGRIAGPGRAAAGAGQEPGAGAGAGVPGVQAAAEHWIHLRTTNPIESTFSTVRLRTKVTRGAGCRAAALAMVFKLVDSAPQRWRASRIGVSGR